jgi:hypothetical protein
VNNFSDCNKANQELQNIALNHLYNIENHIFITMYVSRNFLTKQIPSDFFYTVLRMTKRLNFQRKIQLEADLIMIYPIKNLYKK